MSKRVVLRLDGDLEQGFQVTLEIGEEGSLSFTEAIAALPPAPELAIDLNTWQQHYRQISATTRISLQRITIQAGAPSQKKLVVRQPENFKVRSKRG